MTEPRRPVMPDRANLEIRVEPVIRCSRCGDPLAFGRIGRCDDCIGRGGNPIGCLVLAVVAAVIAASVLVGSSIAAPRGAQTTDLVPSRDLSATPGPSAGLPGAPLPEAGDRLRPPAPPQPPAVANVATSEGLQSPTAPMPAPRFRGLATWFCLSGSSACTHGYDQADLVAAIDSDLGFSKGDRVIVRYGERAVTVTVVDVCRCPGDRLIDLTSGAFRRLADLDLGVIPVLVELAGPGATLPATEAAP